MPVEILEKTFFVTGIYYIDQQYDYSNEIVMIETVDADKFIVKRGDIYETK